MLSHDHGTGGIASDCQPYSAIPARTAVTRAIAICVVSESFL